MTSVTTWAIIMANRSPGQPRKGMVAPICIVKVIFFLLLSWIKTVWEEGGYKATLLTVEVFNPNIVIFYSQISQIKYTFKVLFIIWVQQKHKK
jgi:hypothetical protein